MMGGMRTDPPAPAFDSPAARRERRAWYMYDWANSAYLTTTGTVLFGPYLTVVAKRAACPGQDTDLSCGTHLSVLGIPVAPGSLALYVVTLATIVSALLLPVVGALADRSGRKRTMLCGLAWAGSVAGAGMFLVTGTNWQLGVALQIFATLCFGSTIAVYDSILCDIAPLDRRDEVSSRGWAVGYLGASTLLALNLALITLHDSVGISTETAVRVSLLSAGLWWGLFTIIPFLGLRDRPPAPRPEADGGDPHGSGAAGRGSAASVWRGSFGQLAVTLRHLRGYPETLKFLLAYLLFNDGIQTVIYASGIYAQEELKLTDSDRVMTILLVQIVAFGGALAFGRLAGRIGARRTVLSGLVMWCVVVAIGYVLPERELLPFLALAVLIGVVLGGTQAISRSLYSRMIPAGREAEYFSLYSAMDRGTSWLGTLAFGLMFQLTGSYRYAIVGLVVFFVLGGALLTRVDVRKGVEDAGNVAPALL
jgi:UMF1 family MFS transporter